MGGLRYYWWGRAKLRVKPHRPPSHTGTTPHMHQSQQAPKPQATFPVERWGSSDDANGGVVRCQPLLKQVLGGAPPPFHPHFLPLTPAAAAGQCCWGHVLPGTAQTGAGWFGTQGSARSGSRLQGGGGGNYSLGGILYFPTATAGSGLPSLLAVDTETTPATASGTTTRFSHWYKTTTHLSHCLRNRPLPAAGCRPQGAAAGRAR